MNAKIKSLIKMLCLTCALLFFFSQTGLFKKSSQDGSNTSGSYVKHDFAMGTSFQFEVYGNDLENVTEDCIALVRSVDEGLLSRRKNTSELFKLNEILSTCNEAEVSDELFSVLQKTMQICVASGGALDFTIRPVSALWNIEDADADSFLVPEQSEISNQLKRVGYEYVALDENGQRNIVSTQISSMEFELGAVGKGYALDVMRAYLAKHGNVTGAVIHAGGSVLVYGAKDDNSSFKIGIRDPKGNIDDIIGYLEYQAGTTICVSTSGDYEKYIEKDGIRYHHIIDGILGYPADAGLSSVTVVCEDGLYSDALSTACFVLGYEKSLPLLQQFHAEAVFIDHDNNVICTEGIADHFHEL